MKTLPLVAVGAAALLNLCLPINQASAMGGNSSTASPSSVPAVPASGVTAPEKSIAKKLAKLTSALTLTADEQTKILPILQQEAAEIKALRANTSLSKEDHAAKLKAIHLDAKTKIAAVLSPDQQKKFADMGPGHRKQANS